MFESLKHWFESAGNHPHLFEHHEDETLHAALASLLYHLIDLDHKESAREYQYFSNILRQEFELSEAQVKHLHDATVNSTTDLNADLVIINKYLSNNPVLRMKFMEKLNRLIATDGILDKEISAFYQALHVVFPDIELSD